MGPLAFDTNVLFYAVSLAETPADRCKVPLAAELLVGAMAEQALVVPAQVCLEFHTVLRRKGRMAANEAQRLVEACTDGALIVPTDFELIHAALALAASHNLQTYDAAILAAAARAGCDILYSEDMQNGFEWQSVRVVNPFA